MSTININQEQSCNTYKKLLNNLLEINGVDQAIFTRVNSKDSFDVSSKFGHDVANKIIKQKNFNIKLKEKDLEILLENVKNANSACEIIHAYEIFKVRLFNTKKILLCDPITFETTKKELIEDLQLSIQKTKNRWHLFIRNAVDTNIQENVWPMHVATLFISVATNKKVVYAPLILKEVELSFEKEELILKDASDWKINEKIVFLLRDEGFIIDEKISFIDMDFTEIINLVTSWIKNHQPINFVGNFEVITRENVKNKTLAFHDGVVLGLFKPAGGNLRKTLMQIIEKEEIDSILEINANKSFYVNNLEKYIINNSENLLRIQKSNYSQDKALASSLIQNTIIWGPPGTGKSQVIANIIANTLYLGKTTVVMSQKKAALDVLKQRLGKLSPFVLFVLNDNKMDKKEFYKPLQQFIEAIEYAKKPITIKNKKIITNQQIKTLESILVAKEYNRFDSSIELIKLLNNIDANLDDVFKINNNLKYSSFANNPKDFIKQNAALNQIQKKGLFLKQFPRDFINDSIYAYNFLSRKSNFDLNTLTSLTKVCSKEQVNSIYQAPNILYREAGKNDDVDFIFNYLSKKYNDWIIDIQNNNKEKYKSYVSFSNAARAGVALPYKFVNKHIEIIRELFKVIITTPETSFVNWEKQCFDYAIIDESSQIFLETGLPILYLAKIKIMAGDLEQMQPSRWFLTRDDSDDQNDSIENADSLLRYASDKGVFNIMLNQNFRSSFASLMSFSSKHFYNSKLEVVDKNNHYINQSFDVINVNGIWDKSCNLIEANKVIEIAKENLKNYKKIIILTFNSQQKQIIEKMIIDSVPELYSALELEQLMIRNIENIQGDEADLVIASIVYDSSTNMASTYVARLGGKNALNVAISRAKEKMIVVKSINATSLKNVNSEDFKIFKEWLEFLDIEEKEKRVYSISNYKITESYGDTESNFEREVIDEIIKNIGTKTAMSLIKQYEVGSKRIDIALVDSITNHFILGIEIDGYKYHGGLGFDKYLEDYSRQEFLEAKGYSIFRVNEIDWKLNKEKVLNKISKLLEQNKC